MLATPDDDLVPRRTRDTTPQSETTIPATEALLTEGSVADRAAEIVGYGTAPERLADAVDVTTDDVDGLLEITATARSGARAEAIADAFAQALLEHFEAIAATEHTEAVANAEQRLAQLQTRLREVSDAGGELPDVVEQAEIDALSNAYRQTFDELQQLRASPVDSGYTDLAPAAAVRVRPPEEEAFDTPTSEGGRSLVGAFAGLVVGGLLAVVIGRFDDRIRTAADAEAALHMPVLATVPRIPRRYRRRGTLPPPGAAPDFDGSLRLLRAALFAAGTTVWRPATSSDTNPTAPRSGTSTDSLTSILVTSAQPAEGKSTIVAGLAMALATTRRRVLALDLDLHDPTLHDLLGSPEAPGVAEVVSSASERTDEAHQPGIGSTGRLEHGSRHASSLAPFQFTERLRSELEAVTTEVAPGVWVAPAGRSRSAVDLLPVVAPLIDAAAAVADTVLVDSPPVLRASEASEIVPVVEGVLVVVRASRTKAADAAQLGQRLAHLDARVVGAVLVGTPRGLRRHRPYGSAYAAVASNGHDPTVTPSVHEERANDEPSVPAGRIRVGGRRAQRR